MPIVGRYPSQPRAAVQSDSAAARAPIIFPPVGATFDHSIPEVSPKRRRDRTMGLDLTPTTAQHDLARRTHEFAEQCIRPVAADYDRRQEFPWPVLEEA